MTPKIKQLRIIKTANKARSIQDFLISSDVLGKTESQETDAGCFIFIAKKIPAKINTSANPIIYMP